MKYKNIILLAALSLSNTTTSWETYFERKYNKIAPLLNKQNLTQEDIAALMKVKTICEDTIIYCQKQIKKFESWQTPLTTIISREFKSIYSTVDSSPKSGYGIVTIRIPKTIEYLYLSLAYGLFPIIAPITLFRSLNQWQKGKNHLQHEIQNYQEDIKMCEKYIKNIDVAIAETTSP